jgi:hypothetical protein
MLRVGAQLRTALVPRRSLGTRVVTIQEMIVMLRLTCSGFFLAIVLCVGCGPRNKPVFEKTVPVRGTVSLANGTRLRGGQITFHPKDPTKAEARGQLTRDGQFELGTYQTKDGAMPGSYTVTIQPFVFDQTGNPRPDRSLAIPASYTSPASSPLVVEVKDEGEQQLQLTLR